jgi:hypothetical protein
VFSLQHIINYFLGENKMPENIFEVLAGLFGAVLLYIFFFVLLSF